MARTTEQGTARRPHRGQYRRRGRRRRCFHRNRVPGRARPAQGFAGHPGEDPGGGRGAGLRGLVVRVGPGHRPDQDHRRAGPVCRAAGSSPRPSRARTGNCMPGSTTSPCSTSAATAATGNGSSARPWSTSRSMPCWSCVWRSRRDELEHLQKIDIPLVVVGGHVEECAYIGIDDYAAAATAVAAPDRPGPPGHRAAARRRRNGPELRRSPGPHPGFPGRHDRARASTSGPSGTSGGTSPSAAARKRSGASGLSPARKPTAIFCASDEMAMGRHLRGQPARASGFRRTCR